MDELVARINNLLRGTSTSEKSNLLEYGDLSLNLKDMTLSCNTIGESIIVSKKEFQLIEYFFNNSNIVLNKEMIYDRVWGYDSEIESYMCAGTVNINAGDDGMHGGVYAKIAGGTINISNCYEGIEAQKIYIDDGTIDITGGETYIDGPTTG